MPRIGSLPPATPPQTPDSPAPSTAKRAAAPATRDYFFKTDADIRYDEAAKKWLMRLPNTTLSFDTKPAWLASVDNKNEVLARSQDPARLHAVHDELLALAESCYDNQSVKLDMPRLTARVAGETDRAFLGDLLDLFKIALADETRSTFQYGGAMAGARCSEMNKLTALVKVVEGRIAALG